MPSAQNSQLSDVKLYGHRIRHSNTTCCPLCERDLEGIVAKPRQSRYAIVNGNPAWVKIRNRKYSQLIGRDELFERRYEADGAPKIGWKVCALACTTATGA